MSYVIVNSFWFLDDFLWSHHCSMGTTRLTVLLHSVFMVQPNRVMGSQTDTLLLLKFAWLNYISHLSVPGNSSMQLILMMWTILRSKVSRREETEWVLMSSAAGGFLRKSKMKQILKSKENSVCVYFTALRNVSSIPHLRKRMSCWVHSEMPDDNEARQVSLCHNRYLAQLHVSAPASISSSHPAGFISSHTSGEDCVCVFSFNQTA